jgi:PE family
MSDLFGVPDEVAAAAGNLGGIGSTISAANAAAAFPTTGLAAAGADDVSMAVAELMGGHGQGYQSFAAQIEAFHQQFVQNLSAGASAYAAAEAANAAAVANPLGAVQQGLQSVVNAPAALIGSSANGLPGGAGAGLSAIPNAAGSAGAGGTGGLSGIGGAGGMNPTVFGGPSTAVSGLGSGSSGGRGGSGGGNSGANGQTAR